MSHLQHTTTTIDRPPASSWIMDAMQYMLFKGPQRVNLREEDMSTHKIATIFEVSPSSVFLTDASNMAVFPSNGYFSSVDLTPRAQYEVQGAAFEPQPLPQPRFTFARQGASASSTSSASVGLPPRATQSKSYQRSVFIAELVNGRLQPNGMLVIRFLEGDATVQGILAKVQDALGAYDPLILTDGQGNEILDSEGTRGSIYWKQNARKILALLEMHFAELKSEKRRKSSQNDDAMGLQEAYEKIEEVVMTEEQAEHIRAAFSCCVCKGPVMDPMLATCCRAILGCKTCITRSLHISNECVRCRADNLALNLVEVSGLSEALNALEVIIKVD